jgi:hypothetical protein
MCRCCPRLGTLRSYGRAAVEISMCRDSAATHPWEMTSSRNWRRNPPRSGTQSKDRLQLHRTGPFELPVVGAGEMLALDRGPGAAGDRGDAGVGGQVAALPRPTGNATSSRSRPACRPAPDRAHRDRPHPGSCQSSRPDLTPAARLIQHATEADPLFERNAYQHTTRCSGPDVCRADVRPLAVSRGLIASCRASRWGGVRR